MTTCTLEYSLKGWSFIYAQAQGEGVVRCRNGQQALVTIQKRGGGFTFGKSVVDGGTGVITEVKDISEVFGTYAYIGGHAGATRSVEARVMTKGVVSLALTGQGRGFDLGVAVGGFTIKPR